MTDDPDRNDGLPAINWQVDRLACFELEELLEAVLAELARRRSPDPPMSAARWN